MILFPVVTLRGNSDVSRCGYYYVMGVALLTLQCSSDVIGLVCGFSDVREVILFLIMRSKGNCDVSGCSE